ncbi:MAG: [ribosomal protein S18]-alanine N-acetyltransferase [Acidobacteriaceae bacterium]|jgi:ribosomal-protein-alanine N-acetyltransferase|nr:[ribosomal protein S18]-alanine N-acetyltransferase [Acidobacteriaceae bacterium]
MSQNSPFTVRPYQPADGEAISEICRQSPQPAQWSKEAYDQAHSSGQILRTAELNSQVCGFLVARIIGDEAEILNMAVDQMHRRHGIGSALLTAAISAAQAQNAQNIYLEVRESNAVAISFYRRHGFEKTAERREYYRSPTENAAVMKKLTG